MRSLQSAAAIAVLLCALGAAHAVPLPAASLRIGIEPVVRVGSAVDVTVAALDEFGAPTAGYVGTVHFAIESANADVAAVPAAYTFTVEDQGRHVFTGGLRPGAEATFTVRVTDVESTWLTASAQVTAVAELAPIIVRDASSSAVAGQPWAYNASGRVAAKGALPMEYSSCTTVEGFAVEMTTGQVTWTPAVAGAVESICVRAKNGYGSDEYRFEVKVSALAPAPPQAWLVGEPTQGPAGMEVWLDASQSTVDTVASPLHFAWRFGDGSGARAGTESSARHAYLVPGGWNAEVRIRDAYGAEDSARLAIRVTDAQGQLPPTARIVATQTSSTGAVGFSCACSTDLGALRYRWDFGNGVMSSEANPTVTFAPGRYHPTLLVVAPNGLTGYDSAELLVPNASGLPPSCDAWAEPVSTGLAPFSARLNSAPTAGSAAIVKVEWIIGGAAFLGSEVSYVFPAGVHEARLLVKAADGQTCTAVVPITALAAPGKTPPVILSAPPPPVECGAEWTYQPVATGSAPFTWGLVNAPEGMVIDPGTGQIRWTADPRGTVPFRVTVSSGGASSAQDIALPVPCQPVALTTRGCGAAGGLPALLGGVLAWLGLCARRRRG